MSVQKKRLDCASCTAAWQKQGETYCWSRDQEKRAPLPEHCPSKQNLELVEATFARYTEESEDARIARVAAKVEGLCYQPIPGSDAVNARWTRVEDTIAFAKLMEYKKIGIATCIGMLAESNQLTEILEAQGFEVQSSCCKSGSLDKGKLGIEEKYKVRPGTFEPACNPIAQAELLNAAGMDFNIIVGLCVGHDALFSKHSAAPVTTLVVKDRVTGHNPVSVLYGQNFYYKRLKAMPLVIEGEE